MIDPNDGLQANEDSPPGTAAVDLQFSDLDRARAHLAAVVESSEDAIVSKTLEGIVTSWNQAAEGLFGFRASEMLGQSILRIIPRAWRQ
jgi:PAS domain-containing protein